MNDWSSAMGITLDLSIVILFFVMLLAIGTIGIHVIEWHLYTSARDERDACTIRLTAMTADRDGWRSVGERALLVAQMGRSVTRRAARVVARTGG